ncbi:hypothetical protein I302_101619 [Kwoniella bestiolae CBS 10118]|uniref:Glycosyltransferase family 92 protein n=1 Tax=Kwoniella bestiolae CBS 10118 TaxID=1296100 RepID=A0A1B9GCR5_9TREE|nr:hypothetical protein I302_00300 [Kwoniella bestiolae CBS 10118]OCF28811.1 hypothetical protein I302_00300 [Kwoniella bestiolae CBS 10118]
MVVTLSSPKWIVRLAKVALSLLTFLVVLDFFQPVLVSRATGIEAKTLNSYRLRSYLRKGLRRVVFDENPEQHVFHQANRRPSVSSSQAYQPVVKTDKTAASLDGSPLISSSLTNPSPDSGDIDAQTTPLTLVTKPSSAQSPFKPYSHSQPYIGTMYHMSTSIHPSKDLQHSNYQLSSLWFVEQSGYDNWMGANVQARMSPSVEFLRFACVYTNADGSLTEEVQATVTNQARDEYLLVECQMPTWTQGYLDTTISESARASSIQLLRNGEVRLKSWFDLSNCSIYDTTSDSPHLAWRKTACLEQLENKDDNSVKEVVGPTHTISSFEWSPAAPTDQLSICVSPVRLQASEDGQIPLKHLVEWRVWHMYQGVDSVHWYSRDPKFQSWIDQLNYLLNIHDTYIDAPVLSDQYAYIAKDYADQAVYAADCLMRYGYQDTFQAYIDLDEFLTVRQDPSRNATVRRLDDLGENIGSIAADHTYYGGQPMDLSLPYDSDTFPPNAYSHWDTLEKHDGFRRQKSIHRTAATKMLWVHSSAGLGGYYMRKDDFPSTDQEDANGSLEILHNRNPKPDKLTFDVPVDTEVLESWKDTWLELARILDSSDLEPLHTFTL